MKKYLMLLGAVLCSACIFSCDPATTDDPSTDDPSTDPVASDVTVSISADATFDASFKATLTLSLDKASSADVTVKLAKADIQEGKTNVPADFDKKVLIKAGETKATVEVSADTYGLGGGDYQTAIKIASAEGANVAADAVVYIGLSFEFKPQVDLHADAAFSSNCTATLTVALAKTCDKDVIVHLEKDDASTADFSFPESVTVPAGETTAEVTVTVTVPENLAAGVYPAIIKIASVENGELGSATKVTINLSYPFSTTIYIDGEFSDWDGALEWKTPEDAEFVGVKTLKLAANEKYMYVYFEVVEPNPEDFTMFPMPVDLFLDCDADVNTGGKLTSTDNENTTLPFTDSGLNWYIEMSNLHDGQGYINFSGTGNYHYIGADGGTIWSLENLAPGTDKIFAIGDLGEDGIGRVEIQFERTYYGLVNTQASFGLKLMNGLDGWSCYGLAPLGAKKGDASERVDMAVVNMPVYAE